MGTHWPKRIATLAAVLVAGSALAGCGGASSSAGAQTRTVMIDMNNDEFALSMFEYYPQRLQVRPGDTVEFQQAWTGEPHSVTMGSLVDERIEPIIDLLEGIAESGELPPGEPEEFQAFGEALPFALDGPTMTQNAAQPCYVTEAEFDGTYPGDAATPCARTDQPAFSDDIAIYNSGLIPFEGVSGNTFNVKLADDMAPGTYAFYCNVHGPLQYGELEVKAKGSEIPSAGEVAQQARREMEEETEPLVTAFRNAAAGKPVKAGETGEMEVETEGLNLIGVPTPFFQEGKFVHGIVNEFVPRNVNAGVGEKVTWTFAGFHTISFNVPEYFPIFTIDKETGEVALNPQAQNAEGGWPDRPAPEGGEEGPPPEEEGPPGGPSGEPINADAGKWDGRGFKSTGLSYRDQDTFSVTFTRAGTYTFACLIHPEMVGKVTIES